MTSVETIELVLPPHTNHHGTTFGGQIMAWISNSSLICATRYARTDVIIHSVDDVHFVGPSMVGERIRITARVMFCDGRNIEVGAQAEAHVVGGKERLITKAFLFFGTRRKQPPALSIQCADEQEMRVRSEAIGRQGPSTMPSCDCMLF